MNNNPLVSVIIPTYNRATKLKSAIDSVLQQIYTNIQLIVIDDGSTDQTAELMKEYPQVQYIVQEHAGQAAARNFGLSHSKGTIIANLDSDDIWNPDFISRCVDKLEKDNLDFVFANWLQYTDEGDSWDFLAGDPFLRPYVKETPDHWVSLTYADLRELYLIACPSPSSAVVIRKSSIVSGWDKRIHIGDDWCMYLDVILSKECKVAFTLDKLWKKRIDSLNIYDGRKRSEVLKYLYIADTEIIMDKFEKLLAPEEMVHLKRRYMSSLVELAKHELVRELDFREAAKLFKTSLNIEVYFTWKMVPDVLVRGIRRKIKDYKALKKQRH